MKNNGAALIVAERNRQVGIEGWSIQGDDSLGADILERAALAYRDAEGPDSSMPKEWPWTLASWKPKSRQRNLERSGALYLAAAEKAERARNYEARDRFNDHVQSCGLLLDNLLR